MLVRLDMQYLRQSRGSAKEDTYVRLRMSLGDGREYTIPIRSPIIRGCAQRSDSISFSTNAVDLEEKQYINTYHTTNNKEQIINLRGC
jgi:hypothetical protein